MHYAGMFIPEPDITASAPVDCQYCMGGSERLLIDGHHVHVSRKTAKRTSYTACGATEYWKAQDALKYLAAPKSGPINDLDALAIAVREKADDGEVIVNVRRHAQGCYVSRGDQEGIIEIYGSEGNYQFAARITGEETVRIRGGRSWKKLLEYYDAYIRLLKQEGWKVRLMSTL